MFADPVSNLMLVILLFFAGLLVMFVFILRSLELGAQNQEEISRQIAISLADLERMVADLAFDLRARTGDGPESPPAENRDPLPQPEMQDPGDPAGQAQRE